jgi:hypothetical protein
MFSLMERNDSWQNLLSGLGTGRDKSTHAHLLPDQIFPPEYLEQLYLNDDIAARICDLLPGEMLRQGFSIKVDHELFALNGLGNTLRDVLVKSRIFGAAFIYVGADDGQEQSQPLILPRIKNVRFLTVLTSKDLSYQSFHADPNNAKYGHAELYRLNMSSQHQSTIIHESRLIP